MFIQSFFQRQAGLKIVIRTGCVLAVAVNLLSMAGCVSSPSQELVGRLIQSGESPTPTLATVTDAWREAHAYIAERPGADVVLGSGDSMLPLYRSRTLLVTELRPYQDWLPGQTEVFGGDHGWPVAHLLVAKTAEGWRVVGAARAEYDETLVTPRNYLGTVAKAYELLPIGTRSNANLISELRSGREGAVINNYAALSR